TLSRSLSAGATYYVKVWSPTSSLLAYSLGVAASSGGGKKLVLAGLPVPAVQPAGDFFYRNAADDPDNARSGSRSPVSRTGTSVSATLPATPGATFDGPTIQPSPASTVSLNFAQQTLPTVPAATALAAVAAGEPAAQFAPTWLLDAAAPAVQPETG